MTTDSAPDVSSPENPPPNATAPAPSIPLNTGAAPTFPNQPYSTSQPYSTNQPHSTSQPYSTNQPYGTNQPDGTNQPYGAPGAYNSTAPFEYAAAPGHPAVNAATRRRSAADLVWSIILLVVAVLGALYWTLVAVSLPVIVPGYFISTGASEADYHVGNWPSTLAIVGVSIQIVLLGLTVWLTLLSLRAHRISFWIPLLAGLLSVGFGITVVVVAIYAALRAA